MPGRPSLTAGKGGSGRPQKTGLKKAAKHAARVPGEKAEQRRAHLDAKRAARAAAGGFDARAVKEALVGFVTDGGDVLALQPTVRAGRARAGLCSAAVAPFLRWGAALLGFV